VSVAAPEARDEWRWLGLSLLAVALLAVAQLVGWGIRSLVYEEPSAFELMVRCLHNEKGVVVDLDFPDVVARGAGGGAFSAVVETNGVHVSIGRDAGDAERVVARYQNVADHLPGRLLQRGRTVYLFDRPFSPTQLQTLIDCEYAR
jgi:hypothetical protein